MSLVNYALTIILVGLTEGIFHYISTKKNKNPHETIKFHAGSGVLFIR